jgi:SAM-dependent methyltransferase
MTTWGAGDYPAMAEALVDGARWANRWANIRRGEHVLDLATGTGNFALLAALEGGDVVGVDLEPRLLAIARSRAARSNAGVTWIEADATKTTVPSGWSDVVASVFGVMYASDHYLAAQEIERCLAADGRVVIASWCPGSLLPSIGSSFAPFLQPMSGPAPSAWGDEGTLAGLLAQVGLSIRRAELRTIEFSFRDVIAAVEFFVRTAGYVIVEQPRLEATGNWIPLMESLKAVLSDRSRTESGQFALTGDYLLVAADRDHSNTVR